jgi:DNA mismatch endonuclease (patch repair protein)
MPDVLTHEQRHLNMSRIRAKNTKPEMLVRRGLHARGLRYRLHQRKLPGCPDLVFSHFKAVVFVHGCFWHGHECHLFKAPETRTAFWLKKISGNRERDKRAVEALREQEWRVLTVWECALRGSGRPHLQKILGRVESFLEGSRKTLDLTGS